MDTEGHGAELNKFTEMIEPIVMDEAKNKKHKAIDFDLTEDDWIHFLAGAKQRTYKKGEYVLKEGQPTAALFQIVKGSVRVELQIKDKAQVSPWPRPLAQTLGPRPSAWRRLTAFGARMSTRMSARVSARARLHPLEGPGSSNALLERSPRWPSRCPGAPSESPLAALGCTLGRPWWSDRGMRATCSARRRCSRAAWRPRPSPPKRTRSSCASRDNTSRSSFSRRRGCLAASSASSPPTRPSASTRCHCSPPMPTEGPPMPTHALPMATDGPPMATDGHRSSMHRYRVPRRKPLMRAAATTRPPRPSQLTQSAAEAKAPTVTASNSVRLPISTVMGNPAYNGVLRKFLLAQQAEKKPADPEHPASVALGSFDLVIVEEDFRRLPDLKLLQEKADYLAKKHITDEKAALYLPFFPDQLRNELKSQMQALAKGSLEKAQARRMFSEMAAQALAYLEAHHFEGFLGSEHYNYILELKAKEGLVPKLDQFQVIRVLGEGGFGQVIEVVKRDCGVRYAMKVMQKEAMKQALGITWRKKIAMEANLLAALQHPFMVNLKYAFQNVEFLCLVMDLVPSGDLSEFVLTPRRLTALQSRWAIMETVEVLAYMHAQKILYRDLKPENLLVDDAG